MVPCISTTRRDMLRARPVNRVFALCVSGTLRPACSQPACSQPACSQPACSQPAARDADIAARSSRCGHRSSQPACLPPNACYLAPINRDRCFGNDFIGLEFSSSRFCPSIPSVESRFWHKQNASWAPLCHGPVKDGDLPTISPLYTPEVSQSARSGLCPLPAESPPKRHKVNYLISNV